MIRGAAVVGSGMVCEADVRVAGGMIEAVGSVVSGKGCTEINAEGKVLLPGLIDDQVHFREPGMEHKACIATESAAAVAGGVTTVLEMPNTNPPTVDGQALQDKFERAKRDSMANYGFYLGATADNAEELKKAREYGACGVKVFMGASTGGLLVERQEDLEHVFSSVPEGMVLASHCEDAQRIRKRESMYLKTETGERIVVDVSIHPKIRDEQACLDSTKLAIDLARRHNTRLHVLHISTAAELELFEKNDLAKKLITSEACVHHLWFTDADYGNLGGRIKCNPAIKAQKDRDALRKALTTGPIDVVATDHAPHLLSEKQGSYKEIAAGLPLVGHSLPILLDLVNQGHLRLEDVARLASENPARLFGIKDRGWIKEGMHADLALVNLAGKTMASDANCRYKCGWTPYDGHEFGSSVDMVWVSGCLAYNKGVQDDEARGKRLAFAHQHA